MIVEKSKLKSALAKLSVLVNRESTINGNPTRILFESKDGSVSLTSCDGMNIGVFSFETSDKSNMDFVCDYRTLAAATVLRGDVSLECDGSILTISQGDTKMKYPVKGKDSYPSENKSIDNDNVLVIDSGKLKKLIGKISYIRKDKDPRPFTTGVNVRFDGKKLQMEVTDGPRIFRNYTVLDSENDFSFSGVIGARTVKLIETLDDEIPVSIQMDLSAISIKTGDMKVYMPLLNCKYPNLDKLFSSDGEAKFKLGQSAVLESMEIFSVSDNKALSLSKVDGKLLFSMDDGISDIKDRIEIVSSEGVDFSFAIDFDIFRDLFRNLRESENVEMSWKNDQSPIYFRDDENMEGMLMPLKK